MDDVVVRIVIALGVLGAALLVAFANRRFQAPTHPPVDLSNTNLPNGVVVFTSSDCSNCAGVRRALQGMNVPFREVTWELEPAVFSTAGIESVPLVVVRDDEGVTTGQLAGAARIGRLRSLVGGIAGPSVADS